MTTGKAREFFSAWRSFFSFSDPFRDRMCRLGEKSRRTVRRAPQNERSRTGGPRLRFGNRSAPDGKVTKIKRISKSDHGRSSAVSGRTIRIGPPEDSATRVLRLRQAGRHGAEAKSTDRFFCMRMQFKGRFMTRKKQSCAIFVIGSTRNPEIERSGAKHFRPEPQSRRNRHPQEKTEQAWQP